MGIALDLKEADMPSGIFPVPEFDSTPTPSGPSLATRVWTRWRRNRLDHDLVRGADPAASAALGLRAAQLLSRDERARLANAIVETLGDARRREPVTISARPQRAEVRACADDLMALVLRLRDDQPLDIRGAAMAARLVNDGASPLNRVGRQDLRHAIQAVRVALDAPAQPAQIDARSRRVA
jgi:hypothetical protein